MEYHVSWNMYRDLWLIYRYMYEYSNTIVTILLTSMLIMDKLTVLHFLQFGLVSFGIAFMKPFIKPIVRVFICNLLQKIGSSYANLFNCDSYHLVHITVYNVYTFTIHIIFFFISCFIMGKSSNWTIRATMTICTQ